MKEFINLAYAGSILRNTAPVDDDFPELMHNFDSALRVANTVSQRLGEIGVVCLCGSTKFKSAFEQANKDLTLQGKIVLSVGHYIHADDEPTTPEQKLMLDELHKRKIDLADAILVLNVGGYIGESTKAEIAYAAKHNKAIHYLESQ